MIPNPITSKLLEWLDATTSYDTELKENINLKPNHEGRPQWRRFYQYGPVLRPDDSGLLDADGKPTQLRLDVCAVAYDNKVTPGDIITSGNGQRYMVQTNGSIRKI